MASAFDRWEKDPFFSAAEEVQDSADRMESIYRTWIHAAKYNNGVWNLDELRRGLQTTLGTTKWQLEEFGRAVASSYPHGNAVKDAKERHQNFIGAIQNQVEIVESSLNKLPAVYGKPPSPWTRLDEGERNEFAMFLSGPPSSSTTKGSGNFYVNGHLNGMDECSRSSSHLVELEQMGSVEEKLHGHRRTASASPEINSWKIRVSDEPVVNDSSSSKDVQQSNMPRLSGFVNTLESSISQLKWTNNGYRKVNIMDMHQDDDTPLPKSKNMSRGINIWYEKSKSCLDGCDRNFYGWFGAVQRMVQRSQYQIKYSRPVQAVSIALFCLLVLLALRTI